MRNKIFLLILATLFAGCSGDNDSRNESGQQTTQPKLIVAAPAATPQASLKQEAGYKLLFFRNPEGGPCKMQNAILEGLSEELVDKVTIQYINTTSPGDRPLFSQYGIRALPSLLLADDAGREIKRMPPGIQSPDAIRGLIQSLP
ncbi:MAG: thioredoxin family protein [Desulfobulbaceae bacterium]|nr:thioredoxin family protein [Desulfobulbaceae bacterium]